MSPHLAVPKHLPSVPFPLFQLCHISLGVCRLSALLSPAPLILPPPSSFIRYPLLSFQLRLPTFTYPTSLQQSAVFQCHPVQLLLQFVDLYLSADPVHLPVVLRAVQAFHHCTHTTEKHSHIVAMDEVINVKTSHFLQNWPTFKCLKLKVLPFSIQFSCIWFWSQWIRYLIR